ncbi:hypothetical protein Tco_0232427 [Tanacetum coccineum]
MYHNLNQLQWQLKRVNFHGHDSKTCLVVLRIQLKEFFDLKEVNALDFNNKSWQESFKEGTKWEPEYFRSALLRVLEELDKLIDERSLKYKKLQVKESEVQSIKEIAKRLKESEIQQQESLVNEGTIMEACLSTDGTVMKACLVTEGASLEACLANKGIALNDNMGVTESSGTYDTVFEVPHDMFENVFAHRIQSHEQPNSISDTYKNYEYNVNKRVRNRLSEEFELLVKNINLQLNCFEKSLVKEMKDDLKYDMSLEDEFDGTLSGEKKIIFKNETSSFEIKIKELDTILAQQIKYFEDAKVDFSKKTYKFEKLEMTRVVLERQLDRKIQDSKAEKEQFLKPIASLKSKLASQDLISNQKEYSELRTSYNDLKAKFDTLNPKKGKSPMSNFSTPKVRKNQTTNNSIGSFLKKEKLNGSNFLDWYRNMRIVLMYEQKLHHMEEALPEAPAATATVVVRYAYTRRVAEQQEVACLMLASMTPEIQKNLDDCTAFDIIHELKTIFQQQAE